MQNFQTEEKKMADHIFDFRLFVKKDLKSFNIKPITWEIIA